MNIKTEETSSGCELNGPRQLRISRGFSFKQLEGLKRKVLIQDVDTLWNVETITNYEGKYIISGMVAKSHRGVSWKGYPRLRLI